MDKEFVPKELSLKLKEIGFNEPCFAYYVEEHNNVKIFSEPWSSNLTNTYDYFVGSDNFIPWSCTAPTINQVLRWFEKEHGMYVEWLIDMWGDDEKVSDEMIISALESTASLRQALLKVGLQAQGANYKRLDNIIKKYNIRLDRN